MTDASGGGQTAVTMFTERLTPEQAYALDRYGRDHQRVFAGLGAEDEAIAAVTDLRRARLALDLVHVVAVDMMVGTYVARLDPVDVFGDNVFEAIELVLRAADALARHYEHLAAADASGGQRSPPAPG